MSEAKKTATPVDPYEELVEYTAPYARDADDRPITAVVNGEMIRIARGETVMIPRKHLEVLQNAAKQEMAAHEVKRKAQKAASTPMANM